MICEAIIQAILDPVGDRQRSPATAILDPVGDRQRSPATGVSARQASGGGRR